ncbi:unnamed protein product [Ilex paraguariensis]|uniref:Protein BIC1-like n=1 Tax=Ilex paraguariensis TaxID=185542 RepID=A0ABC8V475_9AQUA
MATSNDCQHQVSSEFKQTHQIESKRPSSELNSYQKDSQSSSSKAKQPKEEEEANGSSSPIRTETLVEESGRERLKRHRVEVAGRVWIPEMWGQEELLKDWIDCTVFDASLGNNNLVSARAALVAEGRNSGRLRIVNRC